MKQNERWNQYAAVGHPTILHERNGIHPSLHQHLHPPLFRNVALLPQLLRLLPRPSPPVELPPLSGHRYTPRRRDPAELLKMPSPQGRSKIYWFRAVNAVRLNLMLRAMLTWCRASTTTKTRPQWYGDVMRPTRSCSRSGCSWWILSILGAWKKCRGLWRK